MESGASRENHSFLTRKFLKITLIEWVAIAFFVIVLAIILLPALYSKGSHGTRGPCRNNLKQLALGLLNYHETYGSFPPAYIADANGKPMHSWRVLILPFIDQRKLYEKYRFNEPWDGSNNRKLHSERVGNFVCPGAREEFDTSYVAVVGPQTAWPGAKPLKQAEITDDPEQTILLVEMKNSGIHWMEPRDLNFEDMSFQVGDPAGNGLGSWHEFRRDKGWFSKEEIELFAQVAFVNGQVRVLTPKVSPETLKALLTIHGGEKLDPADLEW